MSLANPKDFINIQKSIKDVDKQEKEIKKPDTKYDWYKRWHSIGEVSGKKVLREDIIVSLTCKLHSVNENISIEKAFLEYLESDLLTGRAKEDAESIKYGQLKWGFR